MDRTQPLVRLYTVKLLANTWVAEDAAGGLWIVHNNAGGWDSRTPYRGQPLEHYEQHIDPALQARVWGQTWGWPLADESLSMPPNGGHNVHSNLLR